MPMNNILVILVWVIGIQVALKIAKELGFVYYVVDGEKVTDWVEFAIVIGLVFLIERVVILIWKKLRPTQSR